MLNLLQIDVYKRQVVSFMSKKRSNNNYYREIDKDNYINNYNSIKAGIQGDNKKSEVTQKYTRIKRCV